VSPLREPFSAARNEPLPLSAVLVTVIVAAVASMARAMTLEITNEKMRMVRFPFWVNVFIYPVMRDWRAKRISEVDESTRDCSGGLDRPGCAEVS
jgi:hypothetical protein